MSSNIKVKRICEYCNSDFIAQTTTTRYCSKKCNTAQYKAKARAIKVSQSNTETKRIRNKPIQDIQVKEFLTVKDVSILLDCSARTVYRLIENKTLNAVNLAKRITRINRYDVNDLLRFEAPQKMDASQPVYVIKEPKKIEVNINDCYNLTEIQTKYGISEKALHQIIKRNNVPKLKYGWYAYAPKKLIDELLT